MRGPPASRRAGSLALVSTCSSLESPAPLAAELAARRLTARSSLTDVPCGVFLLAASRLRSRRSHYGRLKSRGLPWPPARLSHPTRHLLDFVVRRRTAHSDENRSFSRTTPPPMASFFAHAPRSRIPRLAYPKRAPHSVSPRLSQRTRAPHTRPCSYAKSTLRTSSRHDSTRS